jgi:hypothetical protein
MSKNDKRNEEPEEETPKKPPPEPEFPENDLFTEGVEEPEETKDKEE